MAEKRRESHAGFHFFNLFQNCPRKFFLKYPVGWTPFYTEPPLIEGAAFHEGKAHFYKHGSIEDARKLVEREIKRRKNDYEQESAYERGLYRVPILFTHWALDWGELDLETYEFLEVEVGRKATLPNGFYLTVRPDAIGRRKDDGRIYILETKTTGYSVLITEQGVYYGDQATSYLYATAQAHPSWPIEGVVPDISYWHKGSTDPTKIKNSRGAVVRRSPEQLRQFGLSTMNIISDISQRVKAVQAGIDPLAAFPRNTQWCVSYARPCEYADICRKDNLNYSSIPHGFVRDKWAEKHQVLNFKKIGGTHGNTGTKKAKAGTVQAAVRPDTLAAAVRSELRLRQTGPGSVARSRGDHSLVDHDRNVRDGLTRLLRSWIFCRLPQTRREHYLDLIQDGRGGAKSGDRRHAGAA